MSETLADKIAASEARLTQKLDQILEKREAPKTLFAYSEEDIEDMAARAHYVFIQEISHAEPDVVWEQMSQAHKDAWIAAVNEVLYGSSC
jgi:cellobiose-specific phosphotransferase system component IIB